MIGGTGKNAPRTMVIFTAIWLRAGAGLSGSADRAVGRLIPQVVVCDRSEACFFAKCLQGVSGKEANMGILRIEMVIPFEQCDADIL